MHHRLRYVTAVAAGILSIALAFSMSAGASTRTPTKATAALGAPKHGGSVTDLVNGGEWPGLDPATNTQDAADSTENNAIFGQLFILGPGNVITPDMATGYSFTNHNLTVSVFIRPGQKFTDGSALTASVAVWNIQRDLLPANGCLCLTNFKDVTSVAAKGKYTVVLSLSQPFSPLMAAFINEAPNWMASEQSQTGMGEAAFQQHPIGAGPFEVVSDAASSLLVLKKNPGYWQKGQPYLNNLTFQSTGSDNSDIDALETGQGQFSAITTLSLVSTVKGISSLKLIKTPAVSVEFVALNETLAPFNNLTARQALSYATNAKQLVSSLYYGIYIPVESFTAPGMLFYQKTVPGFDAYDPTKAASLWTSIGSPKFNLDMTSNTLFWIQESDALAQQWMASGIQASVVVDSLQNLLQKLSSNNWVACTANWGGFEPGVELPIYFSSAGQFSGTHDATLDGLMNQGTQYVNATTRNKVYLEIDERLASQAEAVFEYAKPGLDVTVKNFEGFGQGAYSNLYIEWQDVWLK